MRVTRPFVLSLSKDPVIAKNAKTLQSRHGENIPANRGPRTKTPDLNEVQLRPEIIDNQTCELYHPSTLGVLYSSVRQYIGLSRRTAKQ